MVELLSTELTNLAHGSWCMAHGTCLRGSFRDYLKTYECPVLMERMILSSLTMGIGFIAYDNILKYIYR